MQKSTAAVTFLLILFSSIPPLLTLPEKKSQDADRELRFNNLWGESVFSTSAKPMPSVDQIIVAQENKGDDTKVGRNSAGGPIRLGEKTYARGIGVNAPSVIRVSLTKPAARFRADIGLDQSVAAMRASVGFRIKAAGKDVYVSEIMKPATGMRNINVSLDGAQAFELIVEDSDDDRSFDRANWADAQVAFQDGSQLWLDEIANQWQSGTELPFSFIYGGQSSSQLLHTWKREVTEEPIDAGKRRRIVTLTDPKTGLEVRAVAKVYTDTPGVDWTLYFTNRGAADTPIIEKVRALDVSLVPGVGVTPVLHRLNGSTAGVDDWQPLDELVPPGKRISFASKGGRSSQGVSPFFNLEFGGGGVITAFGWSGQWDGAVERSQDGSLHLQAGMENIHLKLHPGETIRSPRILQLYWFGNDSLRSYNLFRRTMFSHVVPKLAGKTVLPPITHMSTSFYELNDSAEANVLSHLQSVKGLGFELFWLDAYWTRDGFPKGMGHYGFPIKRAEPPDRFPNGLKPVSDASHRENMKFLVWFEPERVYSGTHIAKENPLWVINLPKDGSGLFNLGIPKAREFMTKYLLAAIAAYGIDALRIDFNINPGPFWQFLDKKDPDRVGMAEIRYIEGLYQMWDEILNAYPSLFIDNCASGGMRIDLETCSRSLPLWRTDATIGPLWKPDFDQAALQNQVMTAGLNRFVPLSVSGQMGPGPYWFRSGFNGGIVFAEDCRPLNYPRGLLKQAIAEGKRIRKYYLGNFYPLSEVTTSPRDWCVLQYHRPTEQDGMIIAFRRHQSSYGNFSCAPHEIEPAATYELTYYPTYQKSRTVRIPGTALRQLKTHIDEQPSSLLIEYKRIGAEPNQRDARQVPQV